MHVVKNEILEIADRRAWEVTNMIYNNDFSMYRALKAGVNVTKAADSNNPGDTKDLHRMEHGQPVRQKGQDVL